MTGKHMRKIIKQLLLMSCILMEICLEICPAYISKINLSCEKQIILLTLIWVDILGVHLEVGGVKLPPV